MIEHFSFFIFQRVHHFLKLEFVDRLFVKRIFFFDDIDTYDTNEIMIKSNTTKYVDSQNKKTLKIHIWIFWKISSIMIDIDRHFNKKIYRLKIEFKTKMFSIHQQIFEKFSILKKMINDEFAEFISKKISFSKNDENVFERIIEYFYEHFTKTFNFDNYDHFKTWKKLINIYTLIDKFQFSNFFKTSQWKSSEKKNNDKYWFAKIKNKKTFKFHIWIFVNVVSNAECYVNVQIYFQMMIFYFFLNCML